MQLLSIVKLNLSLFCAFSAAMTVVVIAACSDLISANMTALWITTFSILLIFVLWPAGTGWGTEDVASPHPAAWTQSRRQIITVVVPKHYFEVCNMCKYSWEYRIFVQTKQLVILKSCEKFSRRSMLSCEKLTLPRVFAHSHKRVGSSFLRIIKYTRLIGYQQVWAPLWKQRFWQFSGSEHCGVLTQCHSLLRKCSNPRASETLRAPVNMLNGKVHDRTVRKRLHKYDFLKVFTRESLFSLKRTAVWSVFADFIQTNHNTSGTMSSGWTRPKGDVWP